MLGGVDSFPYESLPDSSRQKLDELMKENEVIEILTRTSFWRENFALIVFSVIGSIALFVAVLLVNIGGQTLAILCSFPLALAVSVYTFIFHKKSFIAFTNKRIILKPTTGSLRYVYYTHILNIKQSTNYLQLCRNEIEIRKQSGKDTRPKIFYIDAIPNQDHYYNYLLTKYQPRDQPISPV